MLPVQPAKRSGTRSAPDPTASRKTPHGSGRARRAPANAWEAAAQAAIEAANVPSLIVDIDGKLSEADYARLREELQAAIDAKPGSERVAELVTEGNELRRELAAEQMANVTWRSQNDYFRELVAEILDSFCLPGTASGLLEIRVLVSWVDELRARAGD